MMRWIELEKVDLKGKEIEMVALLVKNQSSLTAIEAHRCPLCGAGLTLGFHPDGRAFVLFCKGFTVHQSSEYSILVPPIWWKDRVILTTWRLDPDI